MSLSKLRREDLNARASELGIDSPQQLANKKTVIEAIENAAVASGFVCTVVESVEADLREIARRDGDLAKSSRAATAMALARELDSARNSATSKSMCAKALNETMDRLQEMAPPEPEEDGVDALSAQRNKRLAGSPAASD